MENYNPNQLMSANTQASVGNVEQKAAQLKQNQEQLAYKNVQQYVRSNQTNNFANTVEQRAQQLQVQDAKNYIQQMNSKIGLN